MSDWVWHHFFIMINQSQSLVIVGAGGHAKSVCDIAMELGYPVECFIDSKKSGESLLGFPIRSSVSELGKLHFFSFAIAIGDNQVRKRIANELLKEIEINNFPSLVHPRATISRFSKIGAGSVMMAGSLLGPNSSVGQFSILTTQSSLDHDSEMLDFSILCPGSMTGGRVKIGNLCMVGMGAMIKDQVQLGDGCAVGANSFVYHDVEPNHLVYGSPAQFVRFNSDRSI